MAALAAPPSSLSPLPYYVSALFAGPQAPLHHAITPLLWSASLALLLSGLFAYLWLRSFASPLRALAATLLYLALPYHLGMDLYARLCLGRILGFRLGSPDLAGTRSANQRSRKGLPC